MKIVFFCGDRSRYGVVHLKPLLESKFVVSKIIIATQERWDMFRQALQGEKYYEAKTVVRWNARSIIKNILPNKIINLLKKYLFKKEKLEMNIIENICREYNVDMEKVFDINEDTFCRKLEEQSYDLFISAAYPQIFSTKLLKIPHKGAVNFHPSALPRCRGAHPHYWALAKGELYGGVTAHFMTEKLDQGDIIAQIKFPILQYDYESHYKKIEEETPELVRQVAEYFEGTSSTIITNVNEKSTYFRNDREIHHRIFWNLHDAEQINNICRAGNAFFFLRGEKNILTKTYVSMENRNMTNNIIVENGAIVDFAKDAVVVSTPNGMVNIQEVMFRGKKLSWRQWVDKCKITIGLKLE